MMDLLEFVATMFMVLVGIAFGAALLVIPPLYYSSCRQASVYNEAHHTSYSCGDFFWASDQINASTHTLKLR